MSTYAPSARYSITIAESWIKGMEDPVQPLALAIILHALADQIAFAYGNVQNPVRCRKEELRMLALTFMFVILEAWLSGS